MASENQKRFYPDYLVEIALVIFLVIELVLILAMLYPKGIGRMIDFTAPFQPRPEWYFLWIYQLVRYFPGRWAFLGTVMIPLLWVLLLIFLPWIDRGNLGRTKAIIVSFLMLSAFLLLTILPLINN